MLFNQLFESDVGSSSLCSTPVVDSGMLLNMADHGKKILLCYSFGSADHFSGGLNGFTKSSENS